MMICHGYGHSQQLSIPQKSEFEENDSEHIILVSPPRKEHDKMRAINLTQNNNLCNIYSY